MPQTLYLASTIPLTASLLSAPPNQIYLPLPMIIFLLLLKNLHFQTHRYGDIVPITAAEKWVATLCMVWGVVLFGYILGGLASLLTNADAQRARYIHRLNTIRYHLVCQMTKCA